MSTSADYVGLGPRVEDPAWVKMSSPTSGVSKKRKKQDTKPISQINKCLNEKRRREQENTYIEELAELTLAQLIKTGISSDMSSLSVKPDKCAILQQAVNQIRRIEGVEGSGAGAVQQGEVSSSKPSLIPNRQIAPILLEALDCFYFQVRNDGKIESVSDNVSQFIKFTSEDITGNSIYNIIHLGDHAKFSTCFLSIGWPTSEKNNESRNRRFNCRLLVKPPDDKDETIEEKQQRVSQYETMQICALLQDSIDKSEADRFEGEIQQILFCLARRIPPNERVQGTPVEQFTTKLDTSGKIIDIDNSGLTLEYTHSINKDLIGGSYVDLVNFSDVTRVTNHLQDTLREGHSTSAIYRVKQRGDPSFIKVQTKSKFFLDTDNTRPEGSFIMATHSIIGLPKEGSGTSTNERSLAGTSGNGGLEETLIGNRPSSTGAAGDDSITSAGDNNNRLRVLLQGSEASEDSQNKILKGLLDQKEEDDGGGSGGGLNMDHILPQLTGSHQQQESTPNNNNMLRDLLNDDDDKGSVKKESALWDLLDEKKPGEFMSPSTLLSVGLSTTGSSSSSSNSMTSSNSLPAPVFSTTAASLTGSGPPPRPSSADILMETARGIKRRSDEPHDGNPSKQTVMAMGAFEKLLGPSPPTPSMSPVGVHGGRPPTPQYGPTTPHGAAPFTPHGPTTPQGRPLTPHGPSTPLTNNSTSNFSLGTGNSVPSPASQVPPGQPSKLQEKNKMLVSLLTKEPAQTPPPTAVVPDPRGLPQEKLPKDLKEKLQTPGPWQGGRTDPVILNSLLKQPPSNPRQLKVNTSVAGQLLSGGPHSAPAHMLSQQPSLNSSGSLSQMGSSPLGNTLSGPSLPSSQAQQPGSSTVGTTGVTGGHLINTISSSSGTTTGTTTLPSFSESMGLNPMGNISTTGIPEGGLPSITTATSQFNPIDDNLHEMVINDILEMTGDESSFSSQVSADENKRQYTSPTYDQNENMAIQQIQNSLMSEVDSNSPNVTGAASIPTYNIVTSPSMSSGGYIPQYSPRGPGGGPGGGGNIGTMGPGGLTMRPGAPQFSPNSQGQQRQPFTPQQIAMLRRRQQEEHQLQMKRRLLQKQQMQQIQFSSSADVSQPPTSTYNNIDDLFNNTVAPNVNVTLQRNVSEAASPQSNYGMLHSPLGPSGGGGGGGGGQQQISPGQQQRIPQPPYSPHGSIASPLSNQQQQQSQYNNNLGNQMNYQNPQLSPRHPQGSPAPPNYPGSGGPALPQISPTGPTTPVSSGISPGQGSPAAWPRTSPQHQRIDSLDQRMDQQRPSLQAQNPILNAQLGSVHPNREMNMMSGGATGGRLMGNVRTQLPPINRSMASPNSRGQSPYIGPPTPGSNDGGPFHPSSPQQGTPPLMYQQQSQPQYRMQRTLSAPGQMPGGNGTLSEYTRNELRAIVGARSTGGGGGGGPGSPLPTQQQQPQQQQPQQQQQQQQQQQSSSPAAQQHLAYQSSDLHHHHHLDQPLLHSYSPSENKWGSENVNTSQGGPLSASPRMDDGRGSAGSEKGKSESMLKHLLSK